MPLAPGTRFGPYEIVAPLGAGGMGEVYRARDTRLGRDVAIKVLPQHLSASPEVRSRFEREARTVSSLNHPHICTLHDVGRAPGEAGAADTDFLVMELVEGETLAQRLERGPLAMPEVLRLGSQVADALDRAHRAGVIHRDLKPGNIMLTKSGAKLLDFGLARATGLVAGGGSATLAGLSQSPTIAQPLTAEGTIVGTFQYMAPEQLEGKEADARSDLWALGCVLYEMATGKRAFDGKSQASLIGSIMNSEPAPISQVAPMSPPALDRLVRACLTKDPDERIQTAHDVKLQIQWIAEGGSQAGVPAPIAVRRRTRERLAWIVAAVAGVAAIALGAMILLSPRPRPTLARFNVAAEPGARNMRWPRLSPDGSLIAYQADDSAGIGHIWIRPVNAFAATPLAGTENAGRPWWSPDGKSLAFTSGSQIKRIAVSGGPAQLVATVLNGSDGSWGAGTILFDGGLTDSLRMVPAEGGEISPATRLDRAKKETYHAWPLFLPDGKRFLFVAGTGSGQGAMLKLGRLGSLDSREIGPVPSRVEYAPPGYVLFIQDGTLMARPFDADRARFTAGPFPVAENATARGDEAHISISVNGTVAFLSGSAASQTLLLWFDRTGKQLEQVGPPDSYRDFALSADGTRLVYGLSDPSNSNQDLWVRDLKRGIATRVTFDPKNELWPVWSPDGARLAYATDEGGNYVAVSRAADGTGGVDTLYAGNGPAGPTSWSADGSTVVGVVFESNLQMWAASATKTRAPARIQSTKFNETAPALSPDGHWLAYVSNETGRGEIFVQAYPGPGGKWRISTNGGTEPHWRADGRELFYRTGDNWVMAVPMQAKGAGLDAGAPVPLFQRPSPAAAPFRNNYDVSADGQRFLLNTMPLGREQNSAIRVIVGWASQARAK